MTCRAPAALLTASVVVMGGCSDREVAGCPEGAECAGGYCSAGACVPRRAPPGCSNLMRDGEEADVDCGGAACAPCAAGQRCALPRDCRVGICRQGRCVRQSAPPLAFGAPATYPDAEKAAVFSIAVGDFNADGLLDLAVGTKGQFFNTPRGRALVRLGQGAAVFGPGRVVSAETCVLVVAADWSGDGLVDLITVEERARYGNLPETSLYYNGGSQGFSVKCSALGHYGWFPADFDRDGIMDSVWYDPMSGTEKVLPEIGITVHVDEPSCNQAIAWRYAAESWQALTPAEPVDLDLDGFPDLVAGVPDHEYEKFLVFHNRGPGSPPEMRFEPPRTVRVKDNRSWIIRAGDFNDDGLPDIVSSSEAFPSYAVLLGDGRLGLTSATTYPVHGRTTSMRVADLNGDGRDDLVTAERDAGGFSVYLGKGDGTFQEPLAFAVGPDTRDVAVGDFDADGLLDVAAGYSEGLKVFLNASR